MKKIFLAALLSGLSGLSNGLSFAQQTWDDEAGDQNWNNPVNWTSDSFPNGVNAIINTSTDGDQPIISATPTSGTPIDIFVGTGGSTGRLDQTAGTAGTGGGNWMFVGDSGGMGTYNLADTTSAVSPGTLTGFDQGSGDFFAGRIHIGIGTGSNGTVNVNTSGSLNVNDGGDTPLILGRDGATGTLNLDAGTINATGDAAGDGRITVGERGGGIGVFNQSGGAVNASGVLSVGQSNPSTGTYNIDGGSLTVSAQVRIGESGTGTVNQTGGTVNASGILTVGQSSSSTGTYNIDGGSLSVSDQVFIAESGTGTVNQTGGTVQSDAWFVVGRNDGSVGKYNLSGGEVNAATATGFTVVGSQAGSSGEINVSGGTFNSPVGIKVGEAGVGGGVGAAEGKLIVSGTGVVNTGTFPIDLGTNSAGVGTVDLDGGEIRTGSVTQGGGTGTFNFNGGELTATQTTTTFMEGLTRANVRDGGATIDTGSNDISINQVLEHSNIGGDNAIDGGLVKQGSGTLTLGATNTYTGGTTVNEGTLSLATGGGSGAIRGTLTIASGADVQLNATDALGFNGGGVAVETINVNGGTLNNNVAGNNGLRASLNLTGGTVTSSGGGTFQIDPGLGASISSNASAAQSTVSSNIEIRGPSTSLAIGVADGAATTDLEISGAMSNSTFDGGSANGITKSGSGTLVLSGNNTYTGPTVVENGILSLSASGSINSTESISIDAGATLNVGSGYSFVGFDGSITGNGDVTGDLTLPSGATIAPGDSIGTLTFSAALEILGALTLEVDASTADRLLVGGQLTIGSGAMLTFIEEATPTAPVIQLATYDTLVGTFDPGNITAQPDNYNIDYAYDFGGGVIGIALVSVPEASSFLAMGLVTGIVTCRLSRRRRRAEQAA